ncbi:MAG TPA: hypothetical protein VF807_00330 [Ktedonobacterales bacterium]
MTNGPRKSARPAASTGSPQASAPDYGTIYKAPGMADWMWLVIFAVVVIGCGGYVWSQLGIGSSLGRAVFAGSILLAVIWATLVYALKLSSAVALGPGGISVVRGPWRSELAWGEVDRLAERVMASNGQRLRWLVIYALDTRELHIREDMVADYQRFRVEVYRRFKEWEDHGGTWGTTHGGPYSATDDVQNLITWWLIGAGLFMLPGLYCAIFVPGGLLLGVGCVLVGLLCAVMALRARLGRQTYRVDAQQVSAHRPLMTVRLAWPQVARVERARSRVSPLYQVAIFVGRIALAIAARADARIEAFPWQPRVPEYLALRGEGHYIRIRLHRVANPDELIAWIEYYDRASRTPRPASPALPAQPAPALPAPRDLTGATGPVDPWGAGRSSEPAATVPPAMSPVQPVGFPPVPSAPPRAGQSHPGNISRPPAASSAPPQRLTRRLGGTDFGEIDARILAVLSDQPAPASLEEASRRVEDDDDAPTTRAPQAPQTPPGPE